MSRRILVEPEAEAELQAAAEWYEAQGVGLGFELLAQAQAASQRIAEGEHGTHVPGAQTGARRVPVPRFPLWIVFIERSGMAVIVAYAYERRRPGYWLTRMPGS